MKKPESRSLPAGWDEKRLHGGVDHYDSLGDEDLAAEAEARLVAFRKGEIRAIALKDILAKYRAA